MLTLRRVRGLSNSYLLAGLLLVMVASVVLLGWYRHIDGLIILQAGFSPMRYNTALSFLILGSALLAQGLQHQRMATALALLVGVFNLLSLLQAPLGINFGIDQLFIVDHFPGLHPGRMATATSVSFLLSMGMLLLSQRRRLPLLVLLLSIILLAQSLGVLISYMFGLELTLRNNSYAGMAMHSALLFLLVAALFLVRQLTNQQHTLMRWLPVAAVVGVITLTLIIWQAVKIQEAQQLNRLLRTHAFSMHEEVEKALYELSTAQRRMARRWSFNNGSNYDSWVMDANEYLRDMPNLHSLEWVDAQGVIRWAVPLADNRNKLDHALNLPQGSALSAGEVDAEDALLVPDSWQHHYFYIAVPVTRHGKPDGHIRTVFDLNTFLNSIIRRQLALGYQAEIRDDQHLVFSNRRPGEHEFLPVRQNIDALGLRWQLALYPTPGLVSGISDRVSAAILISGIVMALLLAVISEYYLIGRRQQRLLKAQVDMLGKSEERFRQLLDTLEDGIFVTQEQRLVFVNGSLPQLLGYQPEDMRGMHFDQLLAPESLSTWRDLYLGRIAHAMLQTVDQPNIEAALLTRDGQALWVELYARRIEHEGRPAVLGIARDITQRRAIEAQSRLNQQRLELVAEGALDCLWDWDVRTNRLFFSDRWSSLLGYDLDELPHSFDAWLSHLHPNDISRVLARLNGHLEARQPYSIEYRLRKKNGEYCWISANGKAVWDDSGKAVRMAGSLTDISARKLADEQLRSSLNFQSAILNSSNFSIIATDMHGTITSFNSAAEDMLGYQAEEVVGMYSPVIFLDAAEVQAYARKLSEETGDSVPGGFPALIYKTTNGAADEQEWHYIRKDGSRFPVQLSMTAIFDEMTCDITGYLGVGSDVSERNAQTALIKNSLAEKETLLKEVYHRVKNNLQVIQSLLSIQGRTLEGEARSAISETAGRISAMALVHEKLYKSGDLSAVKLSEYVNDLLMQLQKSWGGKRRGIGLHQHIDALEIGLDVAIPLGLLINELVSNAFKHGYPEGRTGTIDILFNAANGSAVLSVADDGVGLPPGANLMDGQSMGLKLAESLSRQLGGQLHIEPSDSQGAQFRVLFPRFTSVQR